MIRDLIKYSAVTAKARAMYGKRLTEEDWAAMSGARSLRALWETLRRSGAWTEAHAPACAGSAAALLAAVERQTRLDCDRLCLYLSERDAQILRFFLQSPDGMAPEDAGRWWRGGGARHAGLRRIAGAEIDALNLVYILRLRHFPASVKDADALLIPVRDKLKPELTAALLRAPDDAAVLALLKNTPWGSVFTSLAPGMLEKQYDAYLSAFCRRVLASARPGLVPAQAFMTLKGMERARLLRYAAAIERGIDPQVVY